jgi:hypothetical protein
MIDSTFDGLDKKIHVIVCIIQTRTATDDRIVSEIANTGMVVDVVVATLHDMEYYYLLAHAPKKGRHPGAVSSFLANGGRCVCVCVCVCARCM